MLSSNGMSAENSGQIDDRRMGSMTKTRIGVFLIWAYAASYGLALILALTGGAQSEWMMPLALLMMITPALVAVGMRRRSGEGYGDIAWRRFPPGYLLLALVIPPVVTFIGTAGYAMIVADGPGWVPWLTADAAGMIYPPEDARMGEGPMTLGDLRATIAVKLTLNMLILMVFTFGEEFGWRGYLQPRMERRFGTRRAILLLALVWGFWHSGWHAQGVMMPEGVDPIAMTLLINPLYFLGLGTFYGWLYLRTGSIWVPVVAHASQNKVSGMVATFVDMGPVSELSLMASMSIGWLLVGLCLIPFLTPGRSTALLDFPEKEQGP